MWGISTQESSEGAEKQQTAAPNGFSLFVMRLLLLPLPERVVFFWGLDGEKNGDGGGRGGVRTGGRGEEEREREEEEGSGGRRQASGREEEGEKEQE